MVPGAVTPGQADRADRGDEGDRGMGAPGRGLGAEEDLKAGFILAQGLGGAGSMGEEGSMAEGETMVADGAEITEGEADSLMVRALVFAVPPPPTFPPHSSPFPRSSPHVPTTPPLYAARRMQRRGMQRRTVDYSATVALYLHERARQWDARDASDLLPTSSASLKEEF
ncbi:unnamed protein product [Closterium sp. Naga37s-1]|nr:unnamed protein product [Closterium sp. Naga37s-1]